MANQAARAKAYQEALQLGAVSLEDVIAWSDTVIAAEEEPAVAFLELSLARSDSGAITHLNELALGADEETAFRLLFGMVHKALKAGTCSYEGVAKRLYFWWTYETELSGFGALSSFWDALDLAERGISGDPEQVRREMLEFLEEHKA